MRCSSGKRAYTTEALAIEALLQAHVLFNYRTGTGPVNYYKCEDCGAYHLTSQGLMNEQLTKALADGSIKKLRTAAEWNDRFKNR